MDMYLLLPFIFVFAARSRGVGPLLALWLAAAAAGAVVALGPRWDLRLYAPCFLAGVIAFKLFDGTPRRMPWWTWPPFVVALTLLFLWRPTLKGGWACCLILGIAIPRFAEMPDGLFRLACHLSRALLVRHLLEPLHLRLAGVRQAGRRATRAPLGGLRRHGHGAAGSALPLDRSAHDRRSESG